MDGTIRPRRLHWLASTGARVAPVPGLGWAGPGVPRPRTRVSARPASKLGRGAGVSCMHVSQPRTPAGLHCSLTWSVLHVPAWWLRQVLLLCLMAKHEPSGGVSRATAGAGCTWGAGTGRGGAPPARTSSSRTLDSTTSSVLLLPHHRRMRCVVVVVVVACPLPPLDLRDAHLSKNPLQI
jgi:hypothetical protein